MYVWVPVCLSHMQYSLSKQTDHSEVVHFLLSFSKTCTSQSLQSRAESASVFRRCTGVLTSKHTTCSCLTTVLQWFMGCWKMSKALLLLKMFHHPCHHAQLTQRFGWTVILSSHFYKHEEILDDLNLLMYEAHSPRKFVIILSMPPNFTCDESSGWSDDKQHHTSALWTLCFWVTNCAFCIWKQPS